MTNPRTMLVVGALALAGCGKSVRHTGLSAGTLAVSADGRRLFVADADNDELVVVDAATRAVTARVKVGKGPAKAAVAPDGRVYVADRFARAVSVVDPEAGTETARIAVGAEPVALAFTSDGATLVVANDTGRSVSLVDVAAAAETARIPVDGDPSGVSVVGRRAWVTTGRAGNVAVVDLDARKVANTLSLALPLEKTGGETRIPGQGIDPVFDAASGRLYVPHVQGKLDPVPTDVPHAYSGAPGTLPIVANAIATVDTASGNLLDAPGFDPLVPAEKRASGVPPYMEPVSGPMSGPAAALLDVSGKWLFVANRNSGNVQVLDARPEAGDEPRAAVKVGAGPDGLALDPVNGTTLYVYDAFDHALTVLDADDGKLSVQATATIGTTPLSAVEDHGRRLFFSADDARMTDPAVGGIACASCHPGGREDGRTWRFTEGPRNTPTLAGRGLSRTAPYHWDGGLADMLAFKFVVETRMGGSGTGGSHGLVAADFEAIRTYLETLPAPDNPAREETPSEAVLRGKALFEGKAACATCHSGPDLTDNGFHDVGTFGTAAGGLPERFDQGGVNTPPLHDLFATAPYLHDGSLATLRDRVRAETNPGDRHGHTSDLTEAERDDLVAYLGQL